MYPHYLYIQLHLINPLTATSEKGLYRHIGCEHVYFLFYQQDAWHNATSWLTAYESLKLCTYLQLFSRSNTLPYANGGIMAQHSVLVGWNTMDSMSLHHVEFILRAAVTASLWLWPHRSWLKCVRKKAFTYLAQRLTPLSFVRSFRISEEKVGCHIMLEG